MPGNLVRLCSLPKFELVSCKEDFYFNVDHLRSCDYNDGNAGGRDLNDDENRPQVVKYRDFVNLFMMEAAETYLGREVRNVVVRVPAYFDDSQ